MIGRLCYPSTGNACSWLLLLRLLLSDSPAAGLRWPPAACSLLGCLFAWLPPNVRPSRRPYNSQPSPVGCSTSTSHGAPRLPLHSPFQPRFPAAHPWPQAADTRAGHHRHSQATHSKMAAVRSQPFSVLALAALELSRVSELVLAALIVWDPMYNLDSQAHLTQT